MIMADPTLSSSLSPSPSSSPSSSSLSRGQGPHFFSFLAVVCVMAERLTLLVTCFVVLSNSALVVPGRDLSGSRLLDDWNLFPREEGCVPMHSRYGAMCAGFGYNTTRPVGAAGFNFLHHGSQAEASQQLESFSRLVDTGCSRDLLFLLCAYHFPICNENLMEPITPCRNLCEQVVTNCTPTLLGAGRRWPETINCSDLLTESRLDGARRMHVCVSTTSELEQATRETPVDPRPNPPPQPIQTPGMYLVHLPIISAMQILWKC